MWKIVSSWQHWKISMKREAHRLSFKTFPASSECTPYHAWPTAIHFLTTTFPKSWSTTRQKPLNTVPFTVPSTMPSTQPHSPYPCYSSAPALLLSRLLCGVWGSFLAKRRWECLKAGCGDAYLRRVMRGWWWRMGGWEWGSSTIGVAGPTALK